MKKKILFVILFAAAITAVSVSASSASWKSEAVKQPAKQTAYGAYIDESKKESSKNIEFDSKTLALKYVRTDELKSTSVDKRSDSYGTVDVYSGEDKTEYLFLYNSNTLCGFRKANTSLPALKENAISDVEARQIADAFLIKNVLEGSKYVFFSSVYDQLAGRYDIQYYKPLNGLKTDDIVRIWVKANGEIAAFSAFNMNRYAGDTVKSTALQYAKSKLQNSITSSVGSENYDVVDSYLSKDDSGNVVMTYVVEIKVSVGENSLTQRQVFTQPLS